MYTFKKTEKLIAAFLAVAMLMGQVLVSSALAGNEDTFDPDAGQTTVTATDAGEAEVTPTPTPEALPNAVYAAAAETVENGGITVTVSSNETGEVKDGETYTFNIAISDSRVDIEPNIQADDTLAVKVPSFLTTDNVYKMLNDSGLFQYFKSGAGDYSYDASTHTLTLKFKDLGTGTTVNFNFNLTMTVDATGYDGEGEGEITVELDRGGTATVTDKISIGIGTGTGTGDEQGKPYIVKNIWKNYHASTQNGGATVITDPTKPVGYSFTVGIPDNYTGEVTVRDDLSGGTLALCDANGVKLTGSDIYKAFQIKVNGETVKSYAGALPVTVAAIGTISITEDAGGFTVTVSDPPVGGTGTTANVQVIYSAVIANGDVTSFKNTASLTVTGESPFSGSDSVSAIKYDTNALTVDKFIIDGGREASAVDLEEGTSVTFRIKLTQYGTGPMAEGTEVVLDTLAACFGYDAAKATVSSGAPFAITYNQTNRQVVVTKTGADPIPNGVYMIDFTVNVQLNGLAYGGVATNSVGNTTVVVRRKAKLTVDKTWEAGGTVGSGATFTLYRGNTALGTATSNGNGSYTFYIDADALATGTNTLTLREVVANDATYGAADPVSIKVTKAASGKLTFSDTGTGEKTVSVINKKDDGLGSLTFKKTDADTGAALSGGEYSLYRVKQGAETADVQIGEAFTLTSGGTKTFAGLPYGTYYFLETKAPSGYTPITDPIKTTAVTLDKNSKSAEVTLTNTLYGEGSITVNKTDGTAALAGVAFTLRRGNDVIKTVKTDAEGKAAFTKLPAGTYTVTETVPFGYSGYTAAITVVIDENAKAVSASVSPEGLAAGAATGGSAVTLNWTNTKLFGSITVTKLDAANAAKKLSGAKFILRQNGTQVVETQTTGADGTLAFTGLAYGTYTLVETQAPDGYGIAADLAAGISITVDGTAPDAAYTAYDATLKGSVAVTKTDGTNALSGATFALLTAAEYNSENTVATKVTDSAGKAVFTGLEAGTYYVYELIAPAGFVRDAEFHAVTVGAEGANGRVWNVAQSVSNTRKLFTVRVTKTGSDGALLAGAVFELYSGSTKLASATTDANGAAEFTNVPYGAYRLHEATPPAGYVAAADTAFTVDDGSNYTTKLMTVSVTDEYTTLTVTKFSGDKQGEKLTGAKFVIKNAAGKYITAANGAWTGFAETGTGATEFTTGADGSFTLTHLPLGSYSLVETEAPEGYNKLTSPQAFKVSGQTTAVSVGNALIRGSLAVVKTDIYARPLEGIEFEVASTDGAYTGTLTTDNHGEGGLADLPYGEYTIKETNTPAGCIPAQESFSVTQNGVTVALGIVNEPKRGDIVFTKTDAEGAGLSGAIFMLRAVRAEGEYYTGADKEYYTAVAVSGADGAVRFANVPYGVYAVTEIAAPAGMIKSDETLYVSVEGAALEGVETADITDYKWENTPEQGRVTVKKTDAATGAPLSGATFKLYDENMAAAGAEAGYTTDDNGVFELTLSAGVYFLVETDAPEGYVPDATPLRFVTDGRTDVTVTAKNTPYTGSVVFTKTDAATGAVLSGAEIAVYAKADTGYEHALYTVTTGSDGTASIGAIPFGEYVAVEKIAPAGYELGGDTVKPFSITNTAQTGTVAVGFANAKTVNWYVKLEKTDAESGETLEGAVLRVTHNDETKDYVTGADGLTAALQLEAGSYAVTEFAAPEGYLKALAGWEFTVDAEFALTFSGSSRLEGNTFVITLPNTPVTGTLTLNKTGSDGTKLAGAVFAVEDASGSAVYFTAEGDGVYKYASSADMGASAAVTTPESGTLRLTLLPYGTYKLTETAAPTGYDADGAAHTFTVSAANRESALDIVDAQKLMTLRVYKTDRADADKYLIGAVFEVFRRVDAADGTYTVGASMGEATTGYDGTAVFTLPYGSYVVIETRAPEGYELDAAQLYAVDFDDESETREAELTFSNKKSEYSLEIYKFDRSDETKGLSGAKFLVTDSRGYSLTVETGADGRAVLEDVAYDTYTVQELEAPAGYELNSTVFTVRAEELTDGRAVAVNVPDTFIKADITVRKLDFATGEVIAGAEFELRGADGTPVRFTRDADGIYAYDPAGAVTAFTAGTAVLSGVPEGAYTLAETKAPAGYVALDAAHPVSVTAANFTQGIACDIYNAKRETSVGIMKLDADDSTLRLADAEFTLYAFDAEGKPQPTGAVAVTNASGIAVFTKLVMGNYRIVETKAPYGYKLWSNPIDFKVDGEGRVLVGANETVLTELADEVYIARVVNHAIIKEVTLRKTDAATGTLLAGAQFRVSAADGTYKDFTTGSDGTVKLSLRVGEYTVREISAPSGYAAGSASYKLTVTADGVLLDGKALDSALTVTVTNSRLVYSYGLRVYKTDAATGKPLSGAVFTLRGPSGTFTLTSGSDGLTATLYLLPGVYTLTETKAPTGYVLSGLPVSVTVGSDGSYSLFATGARAVYGTGSVRTVSVTNTASGGGTEEIPLNPPKTGELTQSGTLLAGALMMLLSFCGFLVLLLKKRGGVC